MVSATLTDRDRFDPAEMLWAIPCPPDREEWWPILGSFLDEGGNEATALEWCESGPNFDPAAARQTIRSLAKRPPSGRVGALYRIAADYGYKPSPRTEAPPRAPALAVVSTTPEEKEKPDRPPFDVVGAWEAGEPATAAHPYIARKGGRPDGLRVYRGPARIAGDSLDGALMVPACDLSGELKTLQFITLTGRKLNAPGRPVSGYFTVGELGAGPVAIVEGIGQAWACHEAAGMAAVVAFGAGRMEQAARDVKSRCAGALPVLVADAGKESDCSRIATALRCAWVAMPEGSPANFDACDLQQQAPEVLAGLLRNPQRAPTRWKLAERTAAALFKGEPPAVQWLVKGVFPRGVSALLASPPNVGKSFLALDLCMKVARRSTGLLNISMALGCLIDNHGRAVYVSAEDDFPEIHRRLWSLTGGDMPDRLHVLSLPDVGHFGIIGADPKTGEFHPTAEWLALAEEIRELGNVSLIVLDTLQALTAGDTNTVQATQPLMNEAAAIATATGACVLLLHHLNKGAAGRIVSALDALESIRGSGAIAGAARCAFVLWPAEPKEGAAVCDAIGEKFYDGRVAFGFLAKRYGDAALKDRRVFIRNGAGILCDRTKEYKEASADSAEVLEDAIVSAVREAWLDGRPFAASQGVNGLYGRREELPASLAAKSKQWFEDATKRLTMAARIKAMTAKGGHRLTPADAESAAPPGCSTPEDEAPPPVPAGAGDFLGEVPMRYKMPAEGLRDELRALYPTGTTTAALCAAGHRTATTRKPFGKVGDCFTIGADRYRIREINTVDLESEEGRQAWERLEGWQADYAMAKHGRLVKHGARQTVFERLPEDETSPPENER